MPVKSLKSSDKISEAIETEAVYQYARDSYEGYFQLANNSIPDFSMTKLNQYICDKLQKIIDGERKFYIVEMPPQHGKSTTITKTFPSYYLMKNPDKSVMIAAYTQELFMDFSDSNRKKFARFAPQIAGLQIDANTSNKFTIKNHSGTFYATSIYGSATGKPANLLIIDDPVKDAREARSTTSKKGLIQEFQQSFLTRTHPDTSIILVMTRWAVDDLAGTLLKQMSLPWEELKFPAIAENIPDGETDELGRHNGDYLEPSVQTPEKIESQRKSFDPNAFAALYQQRPTLEGGNLIKSEYINYYVPDVKMLNDLGLQHDSKTTVIPEIHHKIASWDLAYTDKETADFTAGQLWGENNQNYYLINRVNKRLNFDVQCEAVKNMIDQFKPDTTYIEDKANGSALMQRIRDKGVNNFVPVIPHGDKVERLNVVLGRFRAGNIYLPHPRWQPWVRELLDQWQAFPNVEHDDEVDAMTQAISQDNAAKIEFKAYKVDF